MKKLIDDIINCPPVWTIRILAASILSLFSIYTAFFGVFPDMIQRSFHIGIILFLVYLMPLQNMSLEALFKSFKTYIFMILALLSLLVMFYQIIFWKILFIFKKINIFARFFLDNFFKNFSCYKYLKIFKLA